MNTMTQAGSSNLQNCNREGQLSKDGLNAQGIIETLGSHGLKNCLDNFFDFINNSAKLNSITRHLINKHQYKLNYAKYSLPLQLTDTDKNIISGIFKQTLAKTKELN